MEVRGLEARMDELQKTLKQLHQFRQSCHGEAEKAAERLNQKAAMHWLSKAVAFREMAMQLECKIEELRRAG